MLLLLLSFYYYYYYYYYCHYYCIVINITSRQSDCMYRAIVVLDCIASGCVWVDMKAVCRRIIYSMQNILSYPYILSLFMLNLSS